MPIFRGDGGSGESSNSAYANEVAVSASIATDKALAANNSATVASSSANAAVSSEIASAASAEAAALSESNASSSEAAAIAAEALAEKWATELEDVIVADSKYSAFHWAQKAEDAAASISTVTSVALSAPTGFDVAGSPVTSAGTLALSFTTGYSLPTTTKQSDWDTAFGWGNHASAGYATLTGTQSLSNKTLTDPVITGYSETVFALTGTAPAIDASNGTIQTWTLTGASTPTDSLESGESVLILVDDGTANTITWTMVDVWETGGGTAPTLKTTGFTHILLWKVGVVVYAALIGDPA